MNITAPPLRAPMPARGDRLSSAAVRLVAFLLDHRPDADAGTARQWLASICRDAAELDRSVELFERWRSPAAFQLSEAADG